MPRALPEVTTVTGQVLARRALSGYDAPGTGREASVAADSNSELNRRPLATRGTAWAQWLAAALLRTPITPNQISLLGIVFAGLGCWLLVAPPSALKLLGAAACVQLRLLCNMLDGMVAIGGGRQSPTGPLYNEIPDRIDDSLLIVGAGYGIGAPWLGWYAALAAAVTAYIRVLGGSLGFAQDFRGPLSKPQRMAVLTAGCLLAALELTLHATEWALVAAMWVIAIGATLTCATRARVIARQLRAAK